MKKFIIYLVGLWEETYFQAMVLGFLSVGIAGLGTWYLGKVEWVPEVEDMASILLVTVVFFLGGLIGVLFIKRREATIFIVSPTGFSAVVTGLLLTVVGWGIVIIIWINNWKTVVTFFEMLKR